MEGGLMRVIAGEAKGRKLLSVPGQATRPITDRVKESLFNILGRRVVDALFLDLFAGTGSVGIEALSRGACRAVFVERNRQALKVIAENLKKTRLAERAQVVSSDVFKFLRGKFDEKFDLVYIAPPQYKGLWAKTLLALDGRELLADEGLIIVQMHPKELASLDLKFLQLADQRKYGSTLLCFYSRSETGARDAKPSASEAISP
jgi:16S rRNA (guanine966-N2)-methyltransferase